MPSDIVTSFPPYFCRGEVVKGFGRGSKELGIPTGELCFHTVDISNQFVFMLVHVETKLGNF